MQWCNNLFFFEFQGGIEDSRRGVEYIWFGCKSFLGVKKQKQN